MRYGLLVIMLVILCLQSTAQVKTLRAVKASITPRIDGSLDDIAWKDVPLATGFICNAPIFGKPASLATEVKVVYDNVAIYVGAFLYDDPSKIRSQMSQRDKEQGLDVDYFAVFLDTYKDKQNGFEFLVTARNVQTDARLSPLEEADPGQYGDLHWDAVWDSKVSKKENGWVVEIKIPYSAVRFSKKDVQEWGINFLRFTRRTNEVSFWNPVDPNENGFVNQFGNLTGLQNLTPPLRLSFSPYISTGFRSTYHDNGSYNNEWLKSGGMDVKYGVNESFTLDATLIPDFGQVISDNVVNNVTPYEVQFQENRAFFTEGTELFNKAGIFYSRRVGRQPGKYNDLENMAAYDPNYTVLKNPSVTRLYNAIKFSGRNTNNLGIGIFNAITQPMYGKLHNISDNKDSTITTEQLANYNIIVLDQALKNRSSITFTNTNVTRRGSERNANVTALDLSLYDRKNLYLFSIKPRYSTVSGTAQHNGFRNTTEFAKVSGKLQYSIVNDILSDKYDPNDLGYLSAPNKISNTGEISYNIIQPKGVFLNQRYSFTISQSTLYKPLVYEQFMLKAQSTWLFQNFWNLTIDLETTPVWYNDFFELQTQGKKLKKAPFYYAGIIGNSDSRKRLYANWELGFAEGPLHNDPYYRMLFTLRYRFGDRFSLEATYDREYDNGQYGYAFLRESNGDPILSRRRFTQVTTLVSGTYNFAPRMNVIFRNRHYWNRMLNDNFFNVKDDGYWVDRPFLNGNNVNYNTYNFDLFYTWDFRLGSRIILGWKNWLTPTYKLSGATYSNYVENLNKVMKGAGHSNEVTLRFIYYLDYLDLRKKK